jgi:hypothetical protein
MYSAAELIPKPKRHAWVSSCLDHLQLLKQLTSIANDEAGPPECKQNAGKEYNSNPLPHYTGQTTVLDFNLPQSAIGGMEANEITQSAGSESVVSRHLENEHPVGKRKGQDTLVNKTKRSRAEGDLPRNEEEAEGSFSKHARVTSQQSPGKTNPGFMLQRLTLHSFSSPWILPFHAYVSRADRQTSGAISHWGDDK